MVQITQETIRDVAYNLLAKAATQYPKNYLDKLINAFKNEENQASKSVLVSIIQNIIYAADGAFSLCQDTGIPAFHIYLNPGILIKGDIRAAIMEATSKATEEIPIRKNVIDPFSFHNPGNNTGWGTPFVYFHYDSKPGPMLIRAELKGFGGEIKSCLDWIFTSTEKMQNAVLAYVLNNVLLSKGEDCVPGFLGVGVGGYAAEAFVNAKNAVFREISEGGREDIADEALLKFEKRLLDSVNRLGLGPMGVGGKTTTMAVYLERRGTHTAVAPVAVSHQCWASRGSEALILSDQVKYVTPHIQKEDILVLKSYVSNTLSQSQVGEGVFEFNTPIHLEEILKLKAGDIVYLNGIICTSRDGAHRRMIEKIKDGKKHDIPLEIIENGVIFHCGPVVRREQDNWCVHAAGPTTSSRFTKDGAFLVRQGIIRTAIGKGTMGGEMVNALKGKAVYLKAVGGCAVNYQKMITKADVQWLDLGYPEAVWILHVKQFGPLVVGIDAKGNSLTEDVMERVYGNARTIYEKEGLDVHERYIQYPQTFAGLSLEEVIEKSRAS
jgi:fumarate hydratase class I